MSPTALHRGPGRGLAPEGWGRSGPYPLSPVLLRAEPRRVVDAAAPAWSPGPVLWCPSLEMTRRRETEGRLAGGSPWTGTRIPPGCSQSPAEAGLPSLSREGDPQPSLQTGAAQGLVPQDQGLPPCPSSLKSLAGAGDCPETLSRSTGWHQLCPVPALSPQQPPRCPAAGAPVEWAGQQGQRPGPGDQVCGSTSNAWDAGRAAQARQAAPRQAMIVSHPTGAGARSMRSVGPASGAGFPWDLVSQHIGSLLLA